MRDLNYQLKTIWRRNVDGSHATHYNRLDMLQLMANQLHDLGYRHLTARGLKAKHVQALVTHWQSQKITTGTIKNRMAILRWWAEKIGKPGVVAKSNAHYGIEQRQFFATHSKAQTLLASKLQHIPDPSIRFTLELQHAFGLRREEAIKFNPYYADQDDRLTLKASWTKGGKAREIPIRTAEQRQLLNRLHQFAGRGSLIPQDRQYIVQLRLYERYTAAAGFSKLHGLRHHYAQQRYQELTGWPAPAAGGPSAKMLSPEQKELDKAARLIVSRELGHEREQITAIYLSR